jgi:tRNA(Arg) A34 adenosine deaminase TadA
MAVEQGEIAGREGSIPVGCVIVGPDGQIVALERTKIGIIK